MTALSLSHQRLIKLKKQYERRRYCSKTGQIVKEAIEVWFKPAVGAHRGFG
jgi:hypothetical protein